MGKYNQAVITTAGQGLLAGVIASGKALAFTNAKTSTHIYPSGLEALTDITDVMQTDAVSSATVMSNTQVKISTRFTNEGITAAYDINTIGIFAKAEGDTNDTLFAVITAVTPDAMPKYTTTNPVAYIYDITVGMSNADSITLNVSPTGTPSYGDLAAAQTAAENASAANLAPAYDSTATYAKDDFCVNGGKLYQCNADISTAEAFNPAHWTEVKVTEVMGGGGGVTPEIMAQIENAQWKTGSETEIFNDTVTVLEPPNPTILDITEELPETITVIYDGVKYTCNRRTTTIAGTTYCDYGAELGVDTDWSQYPFVITQMIGGDGLTTSLSTETLGDHTVIIKGGNTVYTETFIEAVKSIVNGVEEVATPNLADIAVITPNSDISYSYPLLLINGSTGAISSETQAGTFNAASVLILYRVYSNPRDRFSNDFTTLAARSNNLSWVTKSQVSCVDNVWSITGSATLPTTNVNIRWYSLSLPHDGGTEPA